MSEDLNMEEIDEKIQPLPIAPESDLEIVQAFIRYKEDFKTDHRELGMANEELIKSLKVVETWLKTIEDIQADIEKKAKK